MLRSLRSDAALPANPTAHERLQARIREAAQPVPAAGETPPMPARAALVSGVEFTLDPNPLDVRGMQLHFLDQGLAQVRFRLRDTDLAVLVGLDGAYRIGVDPGSGNQVAGRGRWIQADRFVLEFDTISRINHFSLVIDFEHQALKATVDERGGLIRGLRLVGRAAN